MELTPHPRVVMPPEAMPTAPVKTGRGAGAYGSSPQTAVLGAVVMRGLAAVIRDRRLTSPQMRALPGPGGHPRRPAGGHGLMQSRRMSLVETLANTGSGMLLSWVIGLVVYPLFGFAVGGGQALALTSIFTVVSVARGYAWRRAFVRFRGT